MVLIFQRKNKRIPVQVRVVPGHINTSLLNYISGAIILKVEYLHWFFKKESNIRKYGTIQISYNQDFNLLGPHPPCNQILLNYRIFPLVFLLHPISLSEALE